MKEKLKFKLNLQNFADPDPDPDPDPAMGSDDFPATANTFLTSVEKIAKQNIRAVKSTNEIVDAFYPYKVDDGKVIEEGLIEMAKAQAFSPTSDGHEPSFAPKDPKLWVKYFQNFHEKQYQTTKRNDEIRKVVANKGTSTEEFASQIVETLSRGEGDEDYITMRTMIENTNYGVNASISLFEGGVPLNSKGIMYAIRRMFNAIKATNTAGIMEVDNKKIGPKQGVPVADIRIAISEDVLALIDMTELASLYNLQKEEILGKVVVLPFDAEKGNLVRVYDVKSFGRATRLYEFEEEILKGKRYTNFYLTTDRAYFFNGLFKNYYLDVTVALAAETAKIIGTPTPNE